MNIGRYIKVGLVIVLGIISSCSEQSSKARFEEACSIQIPSGYDVIKDQRVEAGTDYGIEYSIRMKPESINKLTDNIRSSGCYSPVVVQRNNTWIRKEKGYSFYLAKDGVFYEAELDTITRIIRFHEAG